MALRVPESKFWDHFIYLIPPQNPQKDTLGSRIGPQKVILRFFDILASFLECKKAIFQIHLRQSKIYPRQKRKFSPAFETSKPKKKH